MMFCTDNIGLEILKKSIFNINPIDYETIYNNSRKNFIIRFEIGMSKEIIKNGFEISALYFCDILNIKTNDVWRNNIYYDTTINPLETMFIKKNRIDSKIINFYSNTLK